MCIQLQGEAQKEDLTFCQSNTHIQLKCVTAYHPWTNTSLHSLLITEKQKDTSHLIYPWKKTKWGQSVNLK